ncbi:aldehyde dehydrogenase [Mesorhizobium sp. M2D.F.Ca.ET.145.01.1.1]|nr:aldehyde dehydrogenase [Mesorhizobium sp. M2D.F.Ca.ET.145.01.1.1]
MSELSHKDWIGKASAIRFRDRAFIDGKAVPARSGRTFASINPATGATLAEVASCGEEDIDLAVAVARRSFEAGVWSRASPQHRKHVLLRLAELLRENLQELALLESLDMGKLVKDAATIDVPGSAAIFQWYAEAIDKVYDEVAPTGRGDLALVRREPLGVVGAVVPWNFPLDMATWKCAPALAAGNSVVLKPAEQSPFSALRLAELAMEAGLPAGVLNVVTGTGAVTGEALGLHGDVDAIAFTGSGPVGRRLLEYSARSNLKRVFLELGGKSPNIVFADAPDLKQAAVVSANGIFRNSGQVCVAGSRLLVQASVYDRFMDELLSATTRLKVGDPLDLASDVGAVSSAEQLDKNLGFVAMATEEGARLVTGGERILAETGGSYMAPTIFENVTQDMQLAREEVFGPVLGVMRFETEEEAVRLANSTVYGLASAVWTSNLSTAHRMVRAIHAGVVHVNTYGGADVTVPLGGVKQSGFGRDKSLHALEKYLELKTAWISL